MYRQSEGCIGHNAYNITPPDWYYKASKRNLSWMIPATSKKILEVGCAEGYLGAFIKEHFRAEVWGIEFNPVVAETAREKLDRVLTGDAALIIDELESASFDCIVFFDVLEHMMNPELVLKKSKRLLTEDGVAILCVPNVLYISNLYRMLIKKDWEYISHGVLDITHLRFFTKKSLKRMFVDTGFEIISFTGIDPPKGLYLFLFHIFNILTFGYYHESKYTQFACIIKPR